MTCSCLPFESDMFQAGWKRQALADAGTGDGSVHWIWAEYGPPVYGHAFLFAKWYGLTIFYTIGWRWFCMVFPWFSHWFSHGFPHVLNGPGRLRLKTVESCHHQDLQETLESTFEAVASNSWKQPWGVQRIMGICRGIYIHKDEFDWIQILCKTSFTREKWMNDDDDGGGDDDPQWQTYSSGVESTNQYG